MLAGSALARVACFAALCLIIFAFLLGNAWVCRCLVLRSAGLHRNPPCLFSDPSAPPLPPSLHPWHVSHICAGGSYAASPLNGAVGLSDIRSVEHAHSKTFCGGGNTVAGSHGVGLSSPFFLLCHLGTAVWTPGGASKQILCSPACTASRLTRR